MILSALTLATSRTNRSKRLSPRVVARLRECLSPGGCADGRGRASWTACVRGACDRRLCHRQPMADGAKRSSLETRWLLRRRRGKDNAYAALSGHPAVAEDGRAPEGRRALGQARGTASSPQGVIVDRWFDATNALPLTPTQGQIEEEVRRAAEHFNVSSNEQATYVIALPPGRGDSQFVPKGGKACAWHSRAWNNNIINVRFYPYITLPYMPDAGTNCWTNAVNQGFDSFGHGIFDGVSKVLGHEYAETLTDPRIDAWYDDIWNNLNKDGGETGDKCNSNPTANIGASGTFFTVQPLWSNDDGGCVLAGVPTADQTPSSFDFGPGVRFSYSSPVTVQLTNNGDLDLPLVFYNNSSGPWYLIGVNANDFILSSQTCPKILHPGASCSVQVTFRPLDFGARQATLGVNIPLGLGNTGNVTPLTGDGISQWAVFDQNDLVFGGTLISLASAPTPVNLSNQGTVSQLIQQVMLGGSNASDFRIISDRCSDRMLAPSESCLLGISFVPTATGQRQAELEITAAGGVFAIPVQGPGLGPVAQLSANGLIARAHREPRGTYGVRRVHAELTLRHGISVGREAVARLMRLAGLEGISGRPLYRHVPAVATAEDRVQRQFRRDGRDQLWVTDITEHATREGKVYCAVVLDTFSRRIVGWSIDSYPTAALVTNALGMAIEQRRPAGGSTVIHSDQGTQFTSWTFTQRAVDSGLLPSMGSVGDCYDNAMIESFWSRMQVELLDRKGWKTRVELANAIFEYLEIFHNRQRRHSALSMLSPVEYEMRRGEPTAA